jgi:response regulator RpfG family c-di-GMP phosphodiesterase
MPAQAPRKKILLVDDEALNILGLKSVLSREYEVLTALSAEAGLKLLESNRVDAIVSDHRMPGMSGAAFFRELAHRGYKGLRLILTGYSDDVEIDEALSGGFVDAILDKPLRVNLLKGMIEALRVLPDQG